MDIFCVKKTQFFLTEGHFYHRRGKKCLKMFEGKEQQVDVTLSKLLNFSKTSTVVRYKEQFQLEI